VPEVLGGASTSLILYPADGKARFFKILIANYQATEHHMPEECNSNSLAPQLPYFSIDNARVIYTKKV